jgi:predicted O-methyltransferase YrrM
LTHKVTLVKQDGTPESRVHSLLRHSAFALLGLRPILGQHTRAEDNLLRKWAAGRSRLVEIGVAEGASAVTLRQAMSPQGNLALIDPYHLSRLPRLNMIKRVARRAVDKNTNGRVVWIDKFSSEAAKDWVDQIDFLFLDGDHSETGVQRDWDDWHKYVVPGGVVAFHDAAIFQGGWTQPNWGPVKVVNRLFRSQVLSEWSIADEVDSIVVARRS